MRCCAFSSAARAALGSIAPLACKGLTVFLFSGCTHGWFIPLVCCCGIRIEIWGCELHSCLLYLFYGLFAREKKTVGRKGANFPLRGEIKDPRRKTTGMRLLKTLRMIRGKRSRPAGSSQVITCTESAGGLSPTCFVASNVRPQTAVGRPAVHTLIRHPL